MPRPAPCGRRFRSIAEAEDLIQLGAYDSGANPPLDAAIRARPQILEFLRQAQGDQSPRAETLRQLGVMAAALG